MQYRIGPVDDFSRGGGDGTTLPGGLRGVRSDLAAGAQSLFLDANGNGQLDEGEPRLDDPSAPISVAAGDAVALIVKDSSPAGAPFGSQNQITITATFVFTNAAPALGNAVLTRIDLTRIGPATTTGLELLKAVSETSAKPGDTVTYTLTYTNNGRGDLRDIVIHDTTPAFTTFVSAASGAFPEALTGVSRTDPGAGNTGAIVWTFTGTLAPGSTGTVTYTVRIATD